MMDRKNSKRKLILTLIAVIAGIALFWGLLHYIEARGLKDIQFGDSGDWSDEDDTGESLYLADKSYISKDDVDAYLLAGTDAGGTDKGEYYSGELADFISVLLIDNTTQKYGFYQIDRNSMVDVPVYNSSGDIQDFSLEQICTAHWYGKNAEERDENLVNATSELIGGLEIDGYYVISMNDIATFNDAIGGVDVDIEEDMTNTDPDFKAGTSVHLTGKQAEKFLRARMSVGDGSNKGRMKRQQQYMQRAYNMLISQLREKPEYINDLYDQLSSMVESDGTGKRISSIANQLMTYEYVGFISFNGESKVGDTMDDGTDHEEFYVDETSILNGLRKIMDIQEDTSADEEADENDDDSEYDESDDSEDEDSSDAAEDE